MDLNEIRLAILESTGQLSVFKKDVYLKQVLPVVISGTFVDDNIKLLEVNRSSILDFLASKRVMVEEVKYLSSDGYNFYLLESF